MIPNCAMQDRSAPRDLRTVTGIIGSEANRVSIKIKASRMMKETPIGIQSTLADERPKRNRHIEMVYFIRV